MKTLVLDLDLTLIYSSNSPLDTEEYFTTQDGQKYFVSKRPYLKEFLDFCFQNFEVHLCTASVKEYCFLVLKEIEVKPELFKSIQTREDLKKEELPFGKGFVEDYAKCWSNCIAIDDKNYVFKGDNINLIQISAFFPWHENDEELLKIKETLNLLI